MCNGSNQSSQSSSRAWLQPVLTPLNKSCTCKNVSVKIRYDSEYAAKTIQGVYNGEKNRSLYLRIRNTYQMLLKGGFFSRGPMEGSKRTPMKITFEHVKGHSGDKWNDRADFLANLGSAGQTCGVGRFSGNNLNDDDNDSDENNIGGNDHINDNSSERNMTIITANNRHKLQKLGISIDDLSKKKNDDEKHRRYRQNLEDLQQRKKRNIEDYEREKKNEDLDTTLSESEGKKRNSNASDLDMHSNKVKDNLCEPEVKKRIKVIDMSVIDLTDC